MVGVRPDVQRATGDSGVIDIVDSKGTQDTVSPSPPAMAARTTPCEYSGRRLAPAAPRPGRGAKVADLPGLGHWWMLQDPTRGRRHVGGVLGVARLTHQPEPRRALRVQLRQRECRAPYLPRAGRAESTPPERRGQHPPRRRAPFAVGTRFLTGWPSEPQRCGAEATSRSADSIPSWSLGRQPPPDGPAASARRRAVRRYFRLAVPRRSGAAVLCHRSTWPVGPRSASTPEGRRFTACDDLRNDAAEVFAVVRCEW